MELVEPIGGFINAVILIAIISSALSWKIGNKLDSHWISIPTGIVLSQIITIFIAVMYIFFTFTLPQAGFGKSFSLFTKDFTGIISFHFLTGIEFSILGLITSLICFLASFYKTRRTKQ